MEVTDKQVAMLRAFLAGDDAEYDRLGLGSDPADSQPGFNALVASTFVEAVNRRFGPDRKVADIVRFVATVRTKYLEDPDTIDPRDAERLILAALGDQQAAADLNVETRARYQVFLLPALVNESDPDDAGLDDLLARARNQAERLHVYTLP